ncbi:hypothetical protein ASF80_07250 [Microbacterium sp. Leaf159]|nr:hypothetical protein ASF80_07250 [Microbacterium sp. Leaf159]
MNGADSGVVAGKWYIGGMWVRGLCAECNSFAGAQYDTAYGDFATRLWQWLQVGTRVALPSTQPVSLAPGRVSRAILSGMLGISPHVRVLHPSLADQMYKGGPVALPGGLSLRVAIYPGKAAMLAGPMLTGLLDGSSGAINTLATVTFRPLSWALVTTDTDDMLAARGWIDATDWLRYEDDREAHDLRWLAPHGLPVVHTILHSPSNDGMQLYSKDIAPLMRGRIP